MARALSQLRYRLTLAWVDHGHRASAKDEGVFVQSLAATLSVPFISLSAHPVTTSEAGLRDARYQVLDSVDGDVIATAHTASDQAETVLMRMIRGAGTTGLAGIPDVRGRYVRPLLGVTRQEVMEYLNSLQQEYAVDPTNASLEPLRNRIRHTLIPLLESQFQPRIVQSLQRLAELARLDRDTLEYLAHDHVLKHGAEIEAMRGVPAGIRRYVLRILCPVPLSLERSHALEQLVIGKVQGIIELESACVARTEAGVVRFEIRHVSD